MLLILSLELCLLLELSSCFSFPTQQCKSRNCYYLTQIENHNKRSSSFRSCPKKSAVPLFSQVSIREGEKEGVNCGLSQSKINNLPRLYVGDFPPKNTNLDKNELVQGSKVTLTYDQCHYVTKVLRLFKLGKRASIQKMKNSDSVYVRIFDGISGEWLASLHQEEQKNDMIFDKNEKKSSTKNSKPKRSRRRSSGTTFGEYSLYAKCLTKLRHQSPPHFDTNDTNKDNVDANADANENKSISAMKLPWLFFAPITKLRSKILVEKCTELGAGMFFPIMTDRTDCSELSFDSKLKSKVKANSNYGTQSNVLFQVEDDDNDNETKSPNAKLEKYITKLQKIALEASEQSERLTVPSIFPLDTSVISNHDSFDKGMCDIQDLLEYWIKEHTSQNENIDSSPSHSIESNTSSKSIPPTLTNSSQRILLVCRERKAVGSVNILHALQPGMNIEATNQNYQISGNEKDIQTSYAFLVGPEGGWSPKEEVLLDRYALDYPSIIKSVSLGGNKNMILRAETAAIMAVGSWALLHA